jgi:MoaA/NifB/PqqE/SkfB family radical SAM enzyme
VQQLYEIQPAASPHLAQHRLTRLPILLLNIHTLCNCRCVMCDIWKRTEGRELAVADLERHRASLISLGVEQVVFSGGEPLLHRDLLRLCNFFRELGIRITLLTTGLLLNKRAALVARYVDEVIISIDGPPDVHNKIRRIPRAFENIARGVRSVQSLNPALPISCRTTVQKRNHLHLCDTVEAVHEIGLDSISFLPADVTSTAFNRQERWEAPRQNEIALTFAELQELESEIERLIATHSADFASNFIREDKSKMRRLAMRFREHLEGIPPRSPSCNAPWVSAVMEADGNLRPCFFHQPTASTRLSTLAEALNSDSAVAFRATLDITANPTCQNCVCSLNYRSPHH